MAEVVLDANVIVALLYADDSLHERAVDLTKRLEAEGHSPVLVDFLVFEALSVLLPARRATQDGATRSGRSRYNDAKLVRQRGGAIPCS